LKQIDNDGSFAFSKDKKIELSKLAMFAMDQNNNNPFDPTTFIISQLPAKAI